MAENLNTVKFQASTPDNLYNQRLYTMSDFILNYTAANKVGSAVTATAVKLASFKIAAGTLIEGSVFDITALVAKSAATGAPTLKINLSTTDDNSVTNTIATYTVTSTDLLVKVKRLFTVKDTTTLNATVPAATSANNDASTATSLPAITVPDLLTNDLYVTLTSSGTADVAVVTPLAFILNGDK